jgi:hypothetical protein
MSEHTPQDELEERDDVADGGAADDQDEPSDGEPWAKTSSGDADDITES